MSDLAGYFDKIANEFNGYYTGRRPSLVQEIGYRVFRGPGLRKRFTATIKTVGECRNAEILDIGCGPGVYTLYFAKNDSRMTAIDISKNMIEITKKILLEAGIKDFKLVLGDFLEYDFKNSFDHTLLIGFFDYVDKTNRDKYFDKLQRITRKKIIATFPRKFVFQTPIRKTMFWLKKQPVFFYTAKDISDIAARHALRCHFHNSGPIWTVEFIKK